MGIRLLYFIVCESGSVDQRTNKLSLFNVMESGVIYALPEDLKKVAIMDNFEAVCCWYRDIGIGETGYQQRLELIGPDNEVIGDFGPVSFDMPSKRHRQFMSFKGVPIPSPKSGTYIFRIHLREPGKEEKEFGDFPIDVRIDTLESGSGSDKEPLPK